MITEDLTDRYTYLRCIDELAPLLDLVRGCGSVDAARAALTRHVSRQQYENHQAVDGPDGATLHVVRDCARALRGMLHRRAEARSGFSVASAIWDLARGTPRPELGPGFYAELTHLVRGLTGRAAPAPGARVVPSTDLEGREAAALRSAELDRLWARVDRAMSRYPDGLEDGIVTHRAERRAAILSALEATAEEFSDWRWQLAHLARDGDALGRLVELSDVEREAIDAARRGHLPFGVTPYYASLLDDAPSGGDDRALRAQVIPTVDYVERMAEHRARGDHSADFMLERETSPVDLVTRRYPAVAILKPFNTCPQICVYCQRNWEIEDAMAPGAMAEPAVIERALAYLGQNAAIREVLVTGGDPLALPDEQILPLLGRVAALPNVDLIRVGTRTLVTLPMRITAALARGLGALRRPGRRELSIVTHVEHPYEITPELVAAVDRLRREGIVVYNQLVYTFHVSRRFEASKLRMLLKRAGVDPYYTFAPKGKAETESFRVPLARILQEQAEEARLLPGSCRTDEPVFNVPGLGKNHLRALQHRDLISVLPDGSRVYDFHPWEKNILPREPYVGRDIPILSYLERLRASGEDPDAYASIWYYF